MRKFNLSNIITSKHLLLLTTLSLLFLTFFTLYQKEQKSIQLGDTAQKSIWIYLSGLTQDFYSDQEIQNRKILNVIGLKTHTKFIALHPPTRCPEFDNKLCWPHNNETEINTTYEYILKIVGNQKIAGFIGFSNGAFFLNRLVQHKQLNVPVISIAGAGYIENVTHPNVIYMIIGTQDTAHYESVLKIKKHIQNKSQSSDQVPLNINVIEHHAGHEIPEDIVLNLLTSFHTHTPELLFEKRNLSNYCLDKLIKSFGNDTFWKWFDVQACIKKEAIKRKRLIHEEDEIEKWFLERSFEFLPDWEYIGNINQYHIIYSQTQGDTWRREGFWIVEIIGDKMRITDACFGIKHTEVSKPLLNKNSLTYFQPITEYEVCKYAMKESPEIKNEYPKIPETQELYELAGWMTYKQELNKQGKLEKRKIISFQPAEGLGYSSKKRKPHELKELALKILQEN